MSRIGKTPITIPQGVTAVVDTHEVSVKGPKGELLVKIPRGIEVVSKDATVLVSRKGHEKAMYALHGTVRSMVSNAIHGVHTGWSKDLELVGVGYRARIIGEQLELTVGFSHPVVINPPKGISFKVEKERITVLGIDKYLVGQIAANIHKVKKPEPYKGKGIKYVGERIRKKAGKSAKAVGGAGTGAK
jgi:large subunit ribosomal protein L6